MKRRGFLKGLVAVVGSTAALKKLGKQLQPEVKKAAVEAKKPTRTMMTTTTVTMW